MMKLNPLFSLLLILVLAAATTACEVEGCTNPNSDNYAIEATQDDGSCILFREKFEGQYKVAENCPSGNYNFDMNIVASSADENGVIINNLGDLGEAVSASVNGTSITIPNQNITSNGFAVSLNGSGTINGTLLTINYSYNFSGGGETCTMNCTKQ